MIVHSYFHACIAYIYEIVLLYSLYWCIYTMHYLTIQDGNIVVAIDLQDGTVVVDYKTGLLWY